MKEFLLSQSDHTERRTMDDEARSLGRLEGLVEGVIRTQEEMKVLLAEINRQISEQNEHKGE